MSTERRHRNARVRHAKLSSVLSSLSWDQLGPRTLRETKKVQVRVSVEIFPV